MTGFDYEVEVRYVVVAEATHRESVTKQCGYQSLVNALACMKRCMEECENIADEGEGTDFHVTLWQCGDNYAILADFASDDGYLWS